MTADVQVFLYPEELETVPPDVLADRLRKLGCDAASVAVVYHRARRVFPRARTISVLSGTTTYFRPTRRLYGTLVPARIALPGLCDHLLAFRNACDRADLGFRAWIVPLHNEALAAEHPDAAARTIDGSPNGIGLCPSSPDAIELVVSLVADVCAQLHPETVELEAALYPGWEPSYTLTLALEPLSPRARLLAPQCFCRSCRELLGDRAPEIEARTREAAGPPFGAGAWDEELAGTLAAVRAQGVARLVAAAAAAAHAGGSALRVFASGPPDEAALRGLSQASVAAADRLLVGCGPLVSSQLIERFRALRGLVGDRAATASTNWTPERSAASMAADAEALANAGADGLALYNLSLVPDEGIEAFEAAAGAFHDAAAMRA